MPFQPLIFLPFLPFLHVSDRFSQRRCPKSRLTPSAPPSPPLHRTLHSIPANSFIKRPKKKARAREGRGGREGGREGKGGEEEVIHSILPNFTVPVFSSKFPLPLAEMVRVLHIGLPKFCAAFSGLNRVEKRSALMLEFSAVSSCRPRILLDRRCKKS